MVSAGMQPREALREVEARLTAAGCPDADFDAGELFRLVTGQDARLADRSLTAEQAAKLEALTARRAAREPLQYLCGSWPISVPAPAVWGWGSNASARKRTSPAWKRARRRSDT